MARREALSRGLRAGRKRRAMIAVRYQSDAEGLFPKRREFR
jgi:hypothetical protein